MPRDICTRLKRYLYSAKCSWIIITLICILVLYYFEKGDRIIHVLLLKAKKTSVKVFFSLIFFLTIAYIIHSHARYWAVTNLQGEYEINLTSFAS